MDNIELHLRKMPGDRLRQEIQLLEKELRKARKVLKLRDDPEQSAWLCGICKEMQASSVDEVVQHIMRVHKYTQVHAILNCEEIYF